MAYKNNWEPRGVYKVFSGDIDGKQVLDAVVEIEEDARFDQIRYVINDFLAVDKVNATEKEIATVAAIDRAAAKSNPNIRIAVVTDHDRIRELARFYARLTQDSTYQTELFDSLDAARDWASSRV